MGIFFIGSIHSKASINLHKAGDQNIIVEGILFIVSKFIQFYGIALIFNASIDKFSNFNYLCY